MTVYRVYPAPGPGLLESGPVGYWDPAFRWFRAAGFRLLRPAGFRLAYPGETRVFRVYEPGAALCSRDSTLVWTPYTLKGRPVLTSPSTYQWLWGLAAMSAKEWRT